MNRARLLIGAAVLTAFGLLGWYLYTHLEWHATTHRTGYTKEALRNDYHAGLLLLTRLGYPAERSEELTRLDTLAPQTTLLLSGHESFADPALRAKLLGWIERGGHLVVPLNKADQATDPLLEALGIRIRGFLSYESDPYTLQIEQQRLKLMASMSPVFDLDEDPVWRVELGGSFGGSEDDASARVFTVGRAAEGGPSTSGEGGTCPAPKNQSTPADATAPIGLPPEGLPAAPEEPIAEPEAPVEAEAETSLEAAPEEPEMETDNADETELESATVYARFRYGKGFVTVGSLAPFTNDSLEKHDHARFFTRLLSLPEGKRPVLMLFAPDYPGLLSWLLAHAPEAVTGFLLLLLAGLWRVVPRFGPILPEPASGRPGLREHLAASGHFLLKQRSYEALIAPLREEVLRQLEHLQHRHPEIEGLDFLGEHLSGIKAAEIKRAFTPIPDSHHEFLRRSQTLAALHACCKRLRQPTAVPGAPS